MSNQADIAAFFDIDHTVLEVNSGSKWIGHQWKTGQMTAVQLLRAMGWLVQYRFGWLDFEAMSKKVLANYKGQPVAPISKEVEEFFHQQIRATICTEAWERIAEHRAQGHVIALLTSATRFLSAPLAQALEVEHILCTEVEVEEGILTGRHIPPACYGPGKVARAEMFADEYGIDLDRSFFYSDSVSDLPMLERVGEPRVVNPDPRLRRKAIERGWSFETWRAPTQAQERTGHVGA
jgi:HAD superfamily hydrolase (TIGR01490 family)